MIQPQPGASSHVLEHGCWISRLCGGKVLNRWRQSFALLLDPLRAINDPYFTGVIFGRETRASRRRVVSGDEAKPGGVGHRRGDDDERPTSSLLLASGAVINMSHPQLRDDPELEGAQLSLSPDQLRWS